MEKFIHDFSRLMQQHEGHVTGTFDLTFPKAGSGGTDVRLPITFPDWSRIGSILAPKS
jgi:hypothetical protein